MLGIVFCDIHPIERNVEAVALRAEYIVNLRVAFLCNIKCTIPCFRFGIEVERLVTSIGNLDVLLCINAVCSFKLNSIWCCIPYRCTYYGTLKSNLV